MERLCCAILICLLATQAAGAGANVNDPNYPNDPNELLRTRWHAVISVLQNKDIDHKAKEKQVGKIVSQVFDFQLMAKLALGRKHWPKLTEPQRERFTLLFAERLKTSYREKIALYTDEKVLFKPALQKKKKGTIHIPMELIGKDKKVAMLYKLRKTDVSLKVKAGQAYKTIVVKRWKIYDVEIQGVSILLTYRAQFDDILRTGSVEDLLAKLEPPAS
jgi:phospholipid transport system substrate-binding protein